jgi:hypothetical protein
MEPPKSVHADSAGRVNLGKDCAGLLFILTHEDHRLILEPARIVSEKELDQNKVLLNKKEWAKFEALMSADDEPTKALCKLLK